MARLNEPPIAPQPSAETIDAVKRRFLRQNRELAKTNSQQSIRIRSLENDCSRLLAENLALREQVLTLHNNIETRPALAHIDAVKNELEAKLLELGGLVAGLSKVKSGSERDTGRRKSQATARRRSGERQWRSGLGLQEVENGMLPTIAEDKYYPRRTLGAEELHQVLTDPDSQSPDIGPPPVSRFEDEDPIVFNTNMYTEEPAEELAEHEEAALSANLETRKKRRESGPKLNIRRVSVFESPEETNETAVKPSRVTKRKFSVQEDEDSLQSKGEPFRFSRRTTPAASETEASNEDSRPSSPERPVLGAKPVNTDPVLTVSPKKQRSSVEEKPGKPAKPVVKPRGRPRLNITRNGAQSDFPVVPIPEPILTAEIVLDSLPPKTPAVESIFSPPSTEPSTQRPENKDTPPPGDLNSSDQTGQGARPGRRARPQVSYKEPSLNVKMRRPDAKLVDAVIDRRISVEAQSAPPTTVKRESSSDLNWKPVTSVSGRGVEEEVEVGSPLRQKLDRQVQDSKTSPAAEPTTERSTASKAISALINETSTAKRRASASADTLILKPASEPIVARPSDLAAPTKAPIIKQEPQEKDSLAVFDFTESSPVDTVPNPRTRITELAKAARNARRHSAMPSTSATTEDRKADRPEGALPSLHKRTGSGSVKSASTTNLGSRSTTNLGKSTSAAARPSAKEKKPTAAAQLPTGGSSNDLRAKVDGVDTEKEIEPRAARETSALRAERAASRRKSMML
ncbi:hypothetical protein T440DRAFT_471997 [Plenodomus tracheiphilus IPT5]|uniref:Shugoshin n=1 Tax=Plenodomus tracheiphilus IPT5 TaxID=1408161 RepID=A0A6A7ATH4_9PLEO|nr:hypothetical protein T440DRAFT_471997 [Plenodomus tracheiphilus IPT5]